MVQSVEQTIGWLAMKSDFRASQTGEMDSSLWRVIRRNLASRPMLMGYAFFFCRSFGKFCHQPTQSLCLLWPTTNWESLGGTKNSWLPSTKTWVFFIRRLGSGQTKNADLTCEIMMSTYISTYISSGWWYTYPF